MTPRKAPAKAAPRKATAGANPLPDVASTPVRPNASTTPTKRGRPSRRGGDRTSAKAREAEAARVKIVCELRRAGVDFDTIAEQAGYSDRSGAWAAWHRAVRDAIREPALEAVELELQRLDVALASIWTQVRRGSLPAVDRFVRLSERRAKLLGLDAAVKVDLTTDEARQEVRDVAAELAEAIRTGQLPS